MGLKLTLCKMDKDKGLKMLFWKLVDQNYKFLKFRRSKASAI
jgi:hypothetical protein